MEQILNKRVDKRQAFVTMGCAMYPYERIKALVGDRDGLNFLDIIALELTAEDKMVTLQQLNFFGPVFDRLLALRYATLTFEIVSSELNAEERTLGSNALGALTAYYAGSGAATDVSEANIAIRIYLQTKLLPLGYEENKRRIGCLENLLSVSKTHAAQSLAESSSIQRSVLGVAFASRQLEELEQLARRFFQFS
jgi:hypothetical protein